MANATVETVTKTVEKEVQERVITLTLTEAEAKSLYALISNVSGNVETSYNAHIYPIWAAVGRLGLGYIPFSTRFERTEPVRAKALPVTLLPSF